jgi:hypothetical protein
LRTGKALAAGDVAVPQVEVLAAVARGRERLYERDEDTLLDAAPALTVDDFTTVARYWRSAADDELSRLDALCAFEARSITMATALDGRVVVQCSFDAEGAEIVSAALDAYDRPDPVCSDGPVRTLGQRRADALVQICSEALGGASGARRHTPTIDGVIDLSRLGHGAPLDLLSRCEIVGIGPVPRVVIERMACDARVGRIVMRGRSEVLDVGRRTRVVPPALRRAIVHRDRHCTFPGCTAPPEWCDVHHCTHWVDGGETNLANCVLLCRRHHVTCHEGGWRLARAPDGTVEISERGTAVRRRRSPP